MVKLKLSWAIPGLALLTCSTVSVLLLFGREDVQQLPFLGLTNSGGKRVAVFAIPTPKTTGMLNAWSRKEEGFAFECADCQPQQLAFTAAKEIDLNTGQLRVPLPTNASHFKVRYAYSERRGTGVFLQGKALQLMFPWSKHVTLESDAVTVP